MMDYQKGNNYNGSAKSDNSRNPSNNVNTTNNF